MAQSYDSPWIDAPNADIDLFLSTYKINTSIDLREKLMFWKKNGYIVFERAVDPELIDAFLDEIEYLKRNPKKYIISVEVRGQQQWSPSLTEADFDGAGVKFNHLHTSSLHAAKLSLAPSTIEFLSAIFQAAPVPVQSLTFWKGSQQPTHIDYPYVNVQRRLFYMAASWLALEDVHPDAGPLAYFVGAHKPDTCGQFDWGGGNIIPQPETRTKTAMEFAHFLDEKLSSANIRPVVFCPKKGDILIWHANMPHQGTPVRNNALTRKSYVTHYTGIDDYPEKWQVNSPQAVHESGGIVLDFPWNKSNGKLPSWRNKFMAP